MSLHGSPCSLFRIHRRRPGVSVTVMRCKWRWSDTTAELGSLCFRSCAGPPPISSPVLWLLSCDALMSYWTMFGRAWIKPICSREAEGCQHDWHDEDGNGLWNEMRYGFEDEEDAVLSGVAIQYVLFFPISVPVCAVWCVVCGVWCVSLWCRCSSGQPGLQCNKHYHRGGDHRPGSVVRQQKHSNSTTTQQQHSYDECTTMMMMTTAVGCIPAPCGSARHRCYLAPSSGRRSPSLSGAAMTILPSDGFEFSGMGAMDFGSSADPGRSPRRRQARPLEYAAFMRELGHRAHRDHGCPRTPMMLMVLLIVVVMLVIQTAGMYISSSHLGCHTAAPCSVYTQHTTYRG